MKSTNKLLGIKTEWAIVTGSGEILERFRSKNTAQQNIPRFKLNKREKLYVEEIDNI